MPIELRLMTANLLNGGADAHRLGEILDDVRPDIVCAQEMAPDAAAAIGERYPHGWLDPRLDNEGRGVASRFPGQFGRLPMKVRPGIWARLSVDDSQLLLVNLHLINPIEFPSWRSVRRRTGQLDDLFHWIDEQGEQGPIVVAGDINASPRWPAYRRLASRWSDLVAETGAESGSGPSATWGWRPGWPRMLRIDHVFGAGVRAFSASVHPIRGSDHAALVVDLRVGQA